MISFIALILGLFMVVDNFMGNFLKIMGLIVIAIVTYIFSNIAGDHIAKKAYKAIEDKMSTLVPTVTEGAEKDLETVDGVLNSPATIIFCRDKTFVGCLTSIKYVFNSEEVFDLRNNEFTTFLTYHSINTFTTVANMKEFNDTSFIKLYVRSGERVVIHYKSFKFSRIERY
jgi:hypothetical protein